MLSPASRGALLTASIISYEFMGLVGGYYAGRLYKSMKGKEWKRAAFLTGNAANIYYLYSSWIVSVSSKAQFILSNYLRNFESCLVSFLRRNRLNSVYRT